MKKFFPWILFAGIVTGCSSVGTAVDMANPLKFFDTGVYPLLIIAELETNLSSVVIDKTKAKIQDFTVMPYEIIPERASVYVMPALIKRTPDRIFDPYYGNMISSYLILNGFAEKASDPEEADFILRTDIEESPEKINGVNFSKISITIMDPEESPIFYSSVYIKSSSDRNFYYHPSKAARPVKELTLAGLEKLFRDGLPEAFGKYEND